MPCDDLQAGALNRTAHNDLRTGERVEQVSTTNRRADVQENERVTVSGVLGEKSKVIYRWTCPTGTNRPAHMSHDMMRNIVRENTQPITKIRNITRQSGEAAAWPSTMCDECDTHSRTPMEPLRVPDGEEI